MFSTIVAASLFFSASAFTPCPLLGPVFEAPTNLYNDTAFQSALSILKHDLNSVSENGKTEFGTFAPESNSFSISIFSTTSSNTPLLSYSHTAAANIRNATEGTRRKINENTIYRIGSLSKLITIYLFLVEVKWEFWNSPITDFVPELEVYSKDCSARGYSVDCVDWRGVTLEALGSQLSGITRDYSGPGELLSQGLDLFPLPAEQNITCNLNTNDPCSTEEYVKGLAKGHPIFAPFSTPIYSNGGFSLLGLALERITGKNISQTIGPKLFDRLNMTRSSYAHPSNLSNALMPGGGIASGFLTNIADETPTGGYYSTLTDLTKLGQSIFNSTLLSPETTRQWLKPHSYTSSLTQGVGKPWEIYRVTNLTSNIFDLYTKSGDIYSYSSNLVLSPDYEVGFVILAAGNATTAAVQYLSDQVAKGIFPALETAARTQADSRFGGYYSLAEHNASLSLTTREGEPGLLVQEWTYEGQDLFDLLAVIYGGEVDMRLYPTNLVDVKGNGTEVHSYRAVFQNREITPNGGVFDSYCSTWQSQDAIQYGGIGIDDFTFDVQGGKVISVSLRVLRTSLNKVRASGRA